MPTVVQQRDVPEAIRELSTMDPPDYVDLFTVTTRGATEASPEQWARAGIDGAAGLKGQFVWRVLCGLRLEGRSSPDHIAGWKIADRGDGWIRVEASGSFMSAHLVVRVDDDQLSIATFVRYDRPLAAIVWPPMSVGHRKAMPGLLRSAARRVSTRTR